MSLPGIVKQARMQPKLSGGWRQRWQSISYLDAAEHKTINLPSIDNYVGYSILKII